MEDRDSAIPSRVERVRASLEAAARRAGRDPSGVALLAAVKGRTAAEIRELAASDVRLLGENRVQEGEIHLAELGAEFRSEVTVRFIGRLQANKARRALRAFDSVDSVDSLELAHRLSRLAVEEEVEREVLLEVNLGLEEQKGGVAPSRARELADALAPLPGLTLAGLQGVPPFMEDPAASRPFFRELASLFEEIRRGHPRPELFRHLSMGMSHDFEVAVEEGATMVRIGTALFGPRRSP
jgi:pyridoxal phosphate enzyme (YggS family)